MRAEDTRRRHQRAYTDHLHRIDPLLPCDPASRHERPRQPRCRLATAFKARGGRPGALIGGQDTTSIKAQPALQMRAWPQRRLGAWGVLMAAGGDKLMTVPGEISWPPLGRST